MVLVTFGGSGMTPRYCHDVDNICRTGLCGQRDLMSLVVADETRAITERVESTGEWWVL